MPKFNINWHNDSADKEKAEKMKDIGILILRIGIGALMLFGHGSEKLVSFAERADTFPDPLGVTPAVSLSLTVFAEFFCSIAILFGFFTRYATIPLIITMLVAIFVIHGDDPWQKQEFATLYLVPYITLLVSGGGRYSVDRKLFGGRFGS